MLFVNSYYFGDNYYLLILPDSMKCECFACGKMIEKSIGHFNRAKKIGAKLFCNIKCFGLSRRKSIAEKKEIKRLYDIQYRLKNEDYIKARMQLYNESTAGRAMQKRNREKFKQNHLEYCRTEKYKKWKYEYDQKHVAKKQYGEFWEASLVLKNIEKVIEPEKYETKLNNGLLNKSQKRKRLWNSMQKI